MDDLSPMTLKEMIISEVMQHTVLCGQKVSTEAALHCKIVNKNLHNQLIHNKVTLDKCKVNTDVTGMSIVTESKITDYSLINGGDDENIPDKVEFFHEESSDSGSNSKKFSIEEVASNDESNDGEKESYQSMLEHLNKLNMAKSLVETPKKKKSEATLKKEVEKGYDDEKDMAEYSTRKYEEDQELNIMKSNYDNDYNDIYGYAENFDIYQSNGGGDGDFLKKSAESLLIEVFMFPRMNTVIDLELKHQDKLDMTVEETHPDHMKKLHFDVLMSNSDETTDGNTENNKFHKNVNERVDVSTKCFKALHIDTDEIKNFKEFSQPSPKEEGLL